MSSEKGMKYSPERTKRICEGLKSLKGRVASAEEAGINYDTFCEWMKKPEFSEEIKKAELEMESKGEHRAIMSIFKAMENQWQAGAWWLERTRPDKYALKNYVEHSGNIGRMLLIRAKESVPSNGGLHLERPDGHNGNGNGNGGPA